MSSPFPPAGVQVLSVAELTRSLKALIEGEHPSVWVHGEVSNLARPASGHVYLTLKDEEAPLKAVVYRGVALRLRYDLTDGMQVIARGRLTIYTPRGEYQLLIEEVQPRGIGPLELAFRQLKEKLFTCGYFDPKRKRPLPRFPHRVALVTSGTGSAVRDVLEILARRWPLVEVWVYPVRVQGDEAAPEIAAALGYLNRVGRADGPTPIDVVLLARGGGSLEDLWPFNEELVAHAVYRSAIPVVTGIGHEDDLTIADLVADVRALTPSEAAERVVPDRDELTESLRATRLRLRNLLVGRLDQAQTRLQQLAGRPCFRYPLEPLRERERRLDELGERLSRSMRRRLEVAGHRVEAAAGRLDSLSPLKVLARGYSLTRTADSPRVLRHAAEVRPGDRIVTRLASGQLISRVEETFDDSAAGNGLHDPSHGGPRP